MKIIHTIMTTMLSIYAWNSAYALDTADLVIHDALISTQDSKITDANAVAVVDGKIMVVGSNEDVMATADDDTTVINANGCRLIPGLNDTHIHAIVGGSSYPLNTQWDGISTLSRALKMLSEQAARTPSGHWVKAVGGWSPHQYEENRYPTMKELNAAVPNHPLLVQHAYNVGFLNQITITYLQENVPYIFDIPQTRWEIDTEGKFTGTVYSEPASWVYWILESAVPQTTDEEARSGLAYFFRDLNRMGITSVSDGGSFDVHPIPDRVTSLFNDGEATIRMSFMEIPHYGLDSSIENMTEKTPINVGENLHRHMDHGLQLEAMGELIQFDFQTLEVVSDWENFMQPIYHPDLENARAAIETDVVKLVTAGIPFRILATYNELITAVLDGIEAANIQTPLNGLRWSIEHAETISLKISNVFERLVVQSVSKTVWPFTEMIFSGPTGKS